jgi:8-oxo-dGTP pyrophosphatase MutT (NUDIX family)
MILQENQRVNVVVRGLAFMDGQLLATQWRDDGAAFPIGGRVEFGESILESLRREVQEETGSEIATYRLVYVAENLFATQGGVQFHEYGWYFWVELDRHTCGLDETIPNPDHPELIIRYLAVDEEHLSNFWPRFLRRYLPADWAQGFAENPRYIYSRQDARGEVQVHELEGLFQTFPGARHRLSEK